MNSKAKRKTAAISGAGGFSGSHLVETLVDHGFDVKCLTHYNSRNDWGWLETIASLETIPRLSVFLIIESKKYNDL